MVTQEDIQNALRTLGLSDLPVGVHASLSSFGCVEGGATTVKKGFLAEGNTLLVPTFSYQFAVPPPDQRWPERNGWDYESYVQSANGAGRIFTPESNELALEEMGAIPAAVLADRARVRGYQPLSSFTAIGPQARKLIKNQSPMDVFAPLNALADAGGWILLIGVGLDKLTLIHAAEEIANRQPFIRWANALDGEKQMVRLGGCANGFPRLSEVLDPLVKVCRVGESTWKAYPAKKTLAVAAQEIRRNPQITHCANANCQRCHDAILGGPK